MITLSAFCFMPQVLWFLTLVFEPIHHQLKAVVPELCLQPHLLEPTQAGLQEVDFVRSALWLRWVVSPQSHSPRRESLLPLLSPPTSFWVQSLPVSAQLLRPCPSYSCLRRALRPRWCWVATRGSFSVLLQSLRSSAFGCVAKALISVGWLRRRGLRGIFWEFGFRLWVGD